MEFAYIDKMRNMWYNVVNKTRGGLPVKMRLIFLIILSFIIGWNIEHIFTIFRKIINTLKRSPNH